MSGATRNNSLFRGKGRDRDRGRDHDPRDEEDDGPRPEAMYWCCADVLVLAAELAQAQLPSATELRTRVLAVLDRMVGTGRAARISDADIAEARYALVAFIDEQILKSNWTGRTEWMNQPLQLQLYKENTAGENFFVRVKTLLQESRPRALEVYYLCLALGFRGAHGASSEGGSPDQYLQAAREQLARTLPSAAKLSPHGRLIDRAETERRSRAPFIALVAGCVLLTASILVGLSWSLRGAVQTVIHDIPQAAATPSR